MTTEFFKKMCGFVAVDAITFPPTSGKSFIMGAEDAMDTGELGLGELAGLTVANEAESLGYDVSVTPANNTFLFDLGAFVTLVRFVLTSS